MKIKLKLSKSFLNKIVKKNLLILIIFFFIYEGFACCQSVTFKRIYNFPDEGLSWSVKQTSDSGYILVGQQYPFGDSLVLIKTNPYGDTLWTKNYCGIDAYWLEITNDNGYIFCGTSPYYCYDTTHLGKTLIKTNSSGDTLWTKKYGNVSLAYLRCVQQTLDGGFILCGNSNPNVIKTDSLGNMEWSRFIPVSDLLSIKQTYDSGFVVAGYAGSFNDSYYMAKLDTGGFLQWYKTFYNSNLENFTDIIQTTDSGFVATGTEQKLYKVDSQGDSVWTSNTGEGGWALDNTNDGGFTAAGSNLGLHLIKWNAAYSIEWSKNFDYYSNFLSKALSVKQTYDGGYIACGFADTGGIRKIYLVKTDSLGNVYTGLNESVKNKTFALVYPNPTKTEAQLLIENFHYSNLKNPEFTLYDLTGKQINTAPIKQWPFIIKRNNLQSGMYFYRVSDEKGLMLSGKLIMQ